VSGEMDFLSPVCAGPITKYSFMYKNGSGTEGLTSSIAVLGRKDESSQWQTLIEKFEFASDTDKHFINEVLSKEDGIKQIKIEIRAGSNPSGSISIESLSVFS
ncbi:MAG: hypothetical protein J6V88_02645, partial [Kiritimatiellae bacterium]|nr:hypothetical protein [Kiritimatiellia bacterium]